MTTESLTETAEAELTDAPTTDGQPSWVLDAATCSKLGSTTTLGEGDV